jgi:hypothetical protein
VRRRFGRFLATAAAVVVVVVVVDVIVFDVTIGDNETVDLDSTGKRRSRVTCWTWGRTLTSHRKCYWKRRADSGRRDLSFLSKLGLPKFSKMHSRTSTDCLRTASLTSDSDTSFSLALQFLPPLGISTSLLQLH